jgi:hypothetical protein
MASGPTRRAEITLRGLVLCQKGWFLAKVRDAIRMATWTRSIRRLLLNNGAASPSRSCAGKYGKTSKPPRFTNSGQEPTFLTKHTPPPDGRKSGKEIPPEQLPPPRPTRFHGTVTLDPARAGRDASKITDEVITHLVGLIGSSVRVTLDIEAEIPAGVPDKVVRTVTENSRTLKFTSHGFESE